MRKNLFNQGYVVQALDMDHQALYSILNKSFRGMGRYESWPLDTYVHCNEVDKTSKDLHDEIDAARWFSYIDRMKLVPSRDFLRRYVDHCDQLGVPTLILMVENRQQPVFAADELEVVERLGFDLVDNVYFSYLTMDIDHAFDPDNPGDECAVFKKTADRLNANRLCRSEKDVYEHIKLRNRLLDQGINLEYSDFAIYPARLSVVKL